MGHLFVSFASVERDRTAQIVEAVRAQGLEVWFDQTRVELDDGNAEEAARSLGKADAIRDELGTQISPVNRARHAETVERLHDALGADKYATAFEARKMERAAV